jgi:hypothetical protein
MFQPDGAILRYIRTHKHLFLLLLLPPTLASVYTSSSHLQPKQQRNNTYDNSGIYKPKCLDCHLQYLNQTGRSFQSRYKEHIHAIKYNKDTSTYAQHILNMGHSCRNIQNTMEIVQITQKIQEQPWKIPYLLGTSTRHTNEWSTIWPPKPYIRHHL